MAAIARQLQSHPAAGPQYCPPAADPGAAASALTPRQLTGSCTMRHFRIALTLVLASPIPLAQPASLDQLLQDIRQLRSREQAAMREREAEFLRERDRQQQLMQQAEQELASLKGEADRLKAEFDRLEQALADTEAQMKQRSGYLGELFGVVRQMASDTRSQWQDSL